MLLAIREKVTGWIAYGIIFLISIPFALWGVNSYFGTGEALPAATVNGQEITSRDLDRAYANYRQRLAQLFGGSIPEALGNEAMLRDQVLSEMIEEYALRIYTENKRYRLSDEALNRLIRGMDAFQTDGQFDTDIYQAQLRSLGYSPIGFEQELRRNGSMEQFQTGIQATAFTPPVLEQRFNSLTNQTRKLRTLTLQLDPGGIEVSEDEIAEQYQSQQNRYRTAERMRIDYIELSLDTVKQNIVVSEDDVYARYQEGREGYTSPEFREASHILIKDGEGEEALQKITEIRNRIINGESFAELAKETSDDPGSAIEGGSLGEIERGVMVPSFEAALFAMAVDELSEPVKTGFGWHIIKLHSISGGETQSFDSLKADLEDEIRTELAESQIFDMSENLANFAYEQSDSLLPAAEQLELDLQTSEWFERGSGTGVAAEPLVRQAAFSDTVLQQGLNSDPIELGDNRVVFLRLKEHQAAAVRPLDEVREQVRADLLQSKLREQSQIQGRLAIDDLKGGKSLEDLAEKWSSDINDRGFVGRDGADLPVSILNRAFSMPHPDQGLVFEGVSQADGDYVVIELSAVVSTNQSGSDGDNVNQGKLTDTRASLEFQSALKLIANNADVTRTPLEDLTTPGY